MGYCVVFERQLKVMRRNVRGFSHDFKKSWPIIIAAKTPPEILSTKALISIALILITPCVWAGLQRVKV